MISPLRQLIVLRLNETRSRRNHCAGQFDLAGLSRPIYGLGCFCQGDNRQKIVLEAVFYFRSMSQLL